MARRFRIDRTTALIALIAVLLGALYMIAATWVESRFAGAVPSGSSLSVSAQGTSAWRDYLERLDQHPHLLTDFSSLPGTGTIVVAAPFEKDFAPRELTALAAWVRRGGRLVLVGDQAISVARDAGMMPSGTTAHAAEASSVPPVFPSELAGGVGSIATGDSGAATFRGPEWVALFGDSAGAAVAQRRFGSGEVVWLVDSMPVANGGIALYDDARFAVRLAMAGPGPVYFDEYHHGITTESTAWSRLGAGGRTAVLLLLAAALVYLFARGRRMGPAIARPELSAARGSAYIAQLASLYRVAGARADALAALEDGLMRTLVRRYGGRAAGLERHARSRAALEDSAALRQRGSIGRDEFVTAAAQLRAARNEVEGGNG